MNGVLSQALDTNCRNCFAQPKVESLMNGAVAGGLRPPTSASSKSTTKVSATKGAATSGSDTGTGLPGGTEANTTESDANDTATAGAPTHLVVLVHGLAGTPEDLTYLKQTLERRGGPGTLVHLARCNKDKTKDGVAEGGTRLAHEVRGVVESTPSLNRISLVGNSLGGLYARYAAKILYCEDDSKDKSDQPSDNEFQSDSFGSDELHQNGSNIINTHNSGGDRRTNGGTVAGLQPAVFMSIAAPHLGVRRFTYVPVPGPLHGLAGVFVGKTGSDLFLTNRRKSSPTPANSIFSKFGSSTSFLASTAAGGNGIKNKGGVAAGPGVTGTPKLVQEGADGGASFGAGQALGENGGSGRDGKNPLLYDMATSEEFLRPLKAFRIRRAYANRRGDFMVPYGTAAFVAPNELDSSASIEPRSGGADDVKGLQKHIAEISVMGQLLGTSRGSIVGTSQVPPAAPGGDVENKGLVLDGRLGMSKTAGREMEEEMAAGLNSCGWQKVAVDFGGVLPLSHNKICALSRSKLAATLYGSGKNIMDHAADFLVATKLFPSADTDSDEPQGQSEHQAGGADDD